MSEFNDLEEGEIVDDSPSHENAKVKTLPRRYRIHNSHNTKKKRKHVPKPTHDFQIRKKLTPHKNTGHFCSRHRSSTTKCCGNNSTPTFTFSQPRFVRQKISPLRTVNVSEYKSRTSFKCSPTIVKQIKPPVKPVITHASNFVNLDLPVQSAKPNCETLSINSSFNDLLAIYKIKQSTFQKSPRLPTSKSCIKRDESVTARSPIYHDDKFNNYRNDIRNHKEDKVRNHKEDDKYVNYKEDKYANYKEDDKYTNYKDDKYVNYKEGNTFRSYKENKLDYKENDNCKNSKPNVQTRDNKVITSRNLSPDSTSKPIETLQVSGSDDEDEEELRRIALASCLKRNPGNQNNLNSNQDKTNLSQLNDAANSVTEDKSSSNSSSFYLMPNLDNYEVVDMDLDAEQSTYDSENELYTKNHSNMMDGSDFFVIDTTSNQEFAMESLESVQMLDVNKPAENFHNRNLHINETSLKNEPVPFLDRSKPVESGPDIWKKLITITSTDTQNEIPKVEKTNVKSNLKVKNRVVNRTLTAVKKINPVQSFKKMPVVLSRSFIAPERIVIKLTGESSSDESDNENTSKNSEESNFAGIEALISSARQMSNDKPEGRNSPTETVNVSCLSKAQQQEYNMLKKIIAQKESSNSQQKLIHSSFDDLKLLEKNLILARSTLQKQKRFMVTARPEVAKKKKIFLSSQLMYQKVREQLVAAENKKNEDAQLYNKSVMQYQALQNSVTKRNMLIKDLERECKRLGLSVHGDSYKPPSVTFPSVNRIKYVKRPPPTNTNL